MLKLTTDKHEASRGGVEILLYLPTVIMYTDSQVNKPNLLFPHYYFPHGIIMPRIFISRIFSVSGECGRYPTPCKEGENCPGNCLGGYVPGENIRIRTVGKVEQLCRRRLIGGNV